MNDPSLRLADQFDLIVGTSTGGLLGLGLSFGKDPGELLAVYKAHGPSIFPPWYKNPRLWRALLPLWPLYSQTALRNVVAAMVPKEKLLGEAKPQVVLTAVRRGTGGITCLKSRRDDHHYRDHAMKAVEAGLATSAAPMAFPHAKTEKHGELLDGGLWANSPILVGLIEAKKHLKQDLGNIRVLSVGTTRAKLPPRKMWHQGGPLEYHRLLPTGRLYDLLFEGQANLARQAAELMLSEGNLLHIDHEFSSSGYSLMDSSPKAIQALEDAGREEGQKNASAVHRLLYE